MIAAPLPGAGGNFTTRRASRARFGASPFVPHLSTGMNSAENPCNESGLPGRFARLRDVVSGWERGLYGAARKKWKKFLRFCRADRV
jgi:hypothetical protein